MQVNILSKKNTCREGSAVIFIQATVRDVAKSCLLILLHIYILCITIRSSEVQVKLEDAGGLQIVVFAGG